MHMTFVFSWEGNGTPQVTHIVTPTVMTMQPIFEQQECVGQRHSGSEDRR